MVSHRQEIWMMKLGRERLYNLKAWESMCARLGQECMDQMRADGLFYLAPLAPTEIRVINSLCLGGPARVEYDLGLHFSSIQTVLEQICWKLGLDTPEDLYTRWRSELFQAGLRELGIIKEINNEKTSASVPLAV